MELFLKTVCSYAQIFLRQGSDYCKVAVLSCLYREKKLLGGFLHINQ